MSDQAVTVTVHLSAGQLLAAGAVCQVHALNPKLAVALYAAAIEAADEAEDAKAGDPMGAGTIWNVLTDSP